MMKYKILITDDNEDDFLLIRQAFSDLNLHFDLKYLRDGQRLIEHLSDLQRNDYPLPDLIVLDLNMPVMGGFEALKIIRTNTAFVKLPVFMYTTSNSFEERDNCMNIGATAYFTKADTYEQVLIFANNINRFIKVSNNPIPFRLADYP